MSTTAQQVFNLAMALIDEVLDDGTISVSDTKTYAAKSPQLITMGQNELYSVGEYFKTLEISNKPPSSILGNTSGMDYIEFIGNELTKEGNGSVKAYYFEVDGECTVYIEDYNGAWNTLATISVPDTVTDFTPYKGIVTPSNGATRSRIRFTGTYRYLITNYAMFSVPYQTSRVPDYRPWIKKEMPSDFKTIDQIIDEYPQRQYAKDSTYKWEGKKDLYINYFYEGNIRIVYKPIPTTVAALTQTLEIDDITATTVLPYFLAAHLQLDENSDNANYFLQRYEQLKALATIKSPVSVENIVDIYGFGG